LISKQAALRAIARDQWGYFTASQALAAGYTYQEQRYHKLRGNWEQVARGIYRLPDYPSPPRDDLIVLTLMSAGRSGEPQAVASHESALAVHDLSDANPSRIHLTVPPGFRKQMPGQIVLHEARLTENEWEERDGYRVTTPLRTILDIAETPASRPYLTDAVYDALQRGMVHPTQLLLAKGSNEARTWLRSALEATEARQHSILRR
jgi:predicted transcriptional regulator of viral defense system